jgi:hypothetical protein
MDRRIFLQFITLLFSCHLIGCVHDGFPLVSGAATGPSFEEDNDQDSQKAELYIYRPFHFYGGGVASWIYVNQHRIVLLKNKGFTKISIAPGKYFVEAAWPHKAKKRKEILVERGMKYYIRVGFDQLDPMVSEIALHEIKNCNYLEPEIAGN